MTNRTNTLCYVEIPAPDLARSRAFYATVFGWKISKGMGDRYLVFDAGGTLSGGLDADAAPVPAGILLYVQVEDIPLTLQKIEAAGGRTLKPKAPVGGDYGFFAHFGDPNGNRLGLISQT